MTKNSKLKIDKYILHSTTLRLRAHLQFFRENQEEWINQSIARR